MGWHFVNKVEKELQQYGRVLVPNDKIRQQNHVVPGSKTLNELDTFIILSLNHEEPSHSLRSYASWLHYFVGTVVSDSPLCRFFKKAFLFSAGLCCPNIIPYDKFKPKNCRKALEYFLVIAMINPYRLKFGDEKSLKGPEVTNRKVRSNPFTGVIPPLLVPSDFRNTYSLTGFCGIDRRSSAVFCSIHDDTNGAPEFAMQVELAASRGFFHQGDILVLNNASIHHGGENSVLEEWMWTTLRVFILFLPPRAPELKLKTYLFRRFKQLGQTVLQSNCNTSCLILLIKKWRSISGSVTSDR